MSTTRFTIRHASGPHARAVLSVAGHLYGAGGVDTQPAAGSGLKTATVGTAEGATLSAGVTASVRLLVRTAAAEGVCAGAEGLLPTAVAELAAVEGWLSSLNRSFSPAEDQVHPRVLSELNQTLQASAFLVGPRLTAADLAWFGAVAPMAAEACQKRPHLARWLQHVQDVSGAAALLERVPESAVPEDEAKSPAMALPAKAEDAPTMAEIAAWMDGAAASFEGLGKLSGNAFAGGADSKKKQKKEKKKKQKAAAAAAPAQPDVWKVDLRVGHIASAEDHPDADKLYVLKIDVGEDEPRTVIAGLRNKIPAADLAGKRCTVLCNVPAGDMQGIESNGRMLVATAPGGEEKKVLVTPPAGAKTGERVAFEGVTAAPEKVVKKKQLNKLLKNFKTSPEGVALWDTLAFTTSDGVCVAEGVSGGTVA